MNEFMVPERKIYFYNINMDTFRKTVPDELNGLKDYAWLMPRTIYGICFTMHRDGEFFFVEAYDMNQELSYFLDGEQGNRYLLNNQVVGFPSFRSAMMKIDEHIIEILEKNGEGGTPI